MKAPRRAEARVGSRNVTSGFESFDDAFFRPSVNGLTPYQPGKPVEDVQRELGLDRVIKLASNEGPFGPFPSALEALDSTARDLNRYPDGGSYRLHEALAARHGVASDEICVGSGADGCIDMISQAILDPGDRIVCGWPSFPSYVIYARKQGAETTLVPLVDHRYDLGALLESIDLRTKLVYICHPNNPTGTMNTTEQLDEYFERVPSHVLTVVDQAYFEYIDRSDYPDAVERYLKAGHRVAVLRTFSKIYGLAGLRVGYAVAPRLCVRGDGEGAPAVRPDDVGAGRGDRKHRRQRRDRAPPRRSTRRGSLSCETALAEHGLEPVPSVGNFLYVDVGADAGALFDRLLHEGIIVRPLAGFGSPTAIRISVGTPEELDLFAAALGRALARA